MSNPDISRRTLVEVSFAGVDISQSIRPYILSLDYTDNEEDEADDLQIKLQDRDGLWMTKWLNDAVQAAASTQTVATGTEYKTYRVTAKTGLNVRSGPGMSYGVIGGLSFGSMVTVASVSNGWAAITYSGRTAYAYAEYLTPVNSESSASSDTVSGMRIQATIARKNWNGDGGDMVLSCGQFELDSIDASGPPATVTIKGTSLPYDAQIRQTQKSKAWEAYTLSGIAKEMATANGMSCVYESAIDPYYARVEQYKMSDIAFLSRLCHDAGISLKATNNILVLFDQEAYEAKPTVRTIVRGDGSYTKYRLSVGKADTEYTSCRVSYVDPSTGRCIEGFAYVEDYKEDSEKNQQLEVSARVSSKAEAEALAKKRLRLHNKYERTASFTLVGAPNVVAGVTILLEDWGSWDGKYIVSQAKHSVGSSGYTTQIKLRRVLEGY